MVIVRVRVKVVVIQHVLVHVETIVEAHVLVVAT